MKHLVVGSEGEVGLALIKLLESKFTVYKIDKEVYINKFKMDVIHIAIPFDKDFKFHVNAYFGIFGTPNTYVIIHSTVEPNTCADLSERIPNIIYSPIRGSHPNLYEDLFKWKKFIAANNGDALSFAAGLFSSLGLEVELYLGDIVSLEMAKLYSTLMYGINLAMAQELIIMKDLFKINTSIVSDFINDTGEVTKDRKLYSYIEKIGGHCVMENSFLLAPYSNLARSLISSNHLFGSLFKDEIFTIKGDKE